MLKDKKKLWVIIIAGLMISSVFGIMLGGFSSPSETVKYNGYSFKRAGNSWITKIGSKTIGIQYLPNEVDDLDINGDALSRLSSAPMVYLTYDINDKNKESISLVQFQLGKMLDENMKIFVAPGFTGNSSYNVPVITCENSTDFLPVIEFYTSNITEIRRFNNNCLIVTGQSQNDFYKARDRILYGLFGVIKNPE